MPRARHPLRPGDIALWLGTASGVLLILLPLAGLIWRAVSQRAWATSTAGALSQALTLSLLTSLISLLAILLVGTPLAYTLARRQFPLRRWINLLVELPIVLPPAVAGLALLLTFGRRGLVGAMLAEAGITLTFTVYAVLLAQMFVAMPFYVRAAAAGFAGVPREMEDAARVDGAGEQVVFWRVTVPLARRGLTAGALLSWARALGEFGATLLFAGNLPGRTQTLPLLIYNILERDLDAAIWTGVLLLGVAAVVLALSHWLTGGRGLEID